MLSLGVERDGLKGEGVRSERRSSPAASLRRDVVGQWDGPTDGLRDVIGAVDNYI
jgi:hypothetical protein